MFEKTIQIIREPFETTTCIPIHAPRFWERKKERLLGCIDDAPFVSSIGLYTNRFEKIPAEGDTSQQLAVVTVNEPEHAHSSNWLNAIILAGQQERHILLTQTNDASVMTRPVWHVMTELNMQKDCPHEPQADAVWSEQRVVDFSIGTSSK